MQFWTIQSREFGRFCGYRRRAGDMWLKRAIFRWDTFPHQGEVMTFLYENEAEKYLAAHPDLPADCKVKFSDLDMENRIYNKEENRINEHSADSLEATINKHE